MLTTFNDTNLKRIDPALFLELQNALDENRMYERLMTVIPQRFKKNRLLHIEIDGCRPCSSPGKVILQRLGSQGVRLSMIIKWLEEIGSEKILMLLKDDEPVNILVQPPESLEVMEGTDLKLTCKATSFPSPKYQWFKENEELLLQQQSQLFIPEPREQDSGTYICRVHSISSKGSNYSCVFSIPTIVKIVFKGKSKKNTDIGNNSMNNLSKKFNTCALSGLKLKNVEPVNSKITISRHPADKVKIAHGGSILLICKARCDNEDYELKYQWYRKGRPIPGATSSEFPDCNIKPDPNTGETKWDYQCKVYHDFDEVMSRSVTVELFPPSENTQYFASEKVAILIANDKYSNMESLYTPANDVITVGEILHRIGFKIFALRNLSYQQMIKAVQLLCRTLSPKAYVVVYFAGHGFELHRQVYLQPVDAKEENGLKTCVCVDYILECLQEHDPALNVLLIDACRTRPFKDGQCVSQDRSYAAETKANTFFGYSTSSMCPSHECDGETNSFFMKYLKEFLPLKMKIQDVFVNFQCKFRTDSLVRNIQFPFLGSNLQEARCLHDEVEKSDVNLFDEILGWTDVKRSLFVDWVCDIQQLDLEIILEFHHHRGVFCNGLDIHVNLDIGENAIQIIDQMEISLKFTSEKIQGIVVQVPWEVCNEVGAICKIAIYEISGLQNFKEDLDFLLVLKHRPSERILLKETVTLGPHPVSTLNLNTATPNLCCEMNIKDDEDGKKDIYN